jgi:hypothetical protein
LALLKCPSYSALQEGKYEEMNVFDWPVIMILPGDDDINNVSLKYLQHEIQFGLVRASPSELSM